MDKALNKYFTKFAQKVVRDSLKNLKKKKGATALSDTVRAEVKKGANGYEVDFYMADYGAFLDKGVSGNKQIQEYTTYDGRVVESPYKFRSKQPPPEPLSKWIKKKGVKPKGLGRGRDKKSGRFISNLAFLIGRKIKRDGLKSLSFFQKPLGLGLKKFGNNILNILADDISDNIRVVQTKINKIQ